MEQCQGQPIRVLHIIPGYGGGISSHVRNLVNGIESDKVVIDVAGFTEYPEDFRKEVLNKCGKLYTLTNVRIHSIIHCLNEMHDILKKGKYHAVHLHLTGLQALYFSTCARLHGIKRIIVHAHIADEKGSDRFGYTIKKRIDQILTTYSATEFASCSKIASSFRFGDKYVRNNRVMHIPNSIDEKQYFCDSEFDEEKYYDELCISKSSLVIGHVGFFGYQKNHIFMFEIAKKLIDRDIDFVWLFIGTGYNFEEYKNIAEKMGITSHIRFLGRRDDVCNLYKIMDVFVLPSFFEGLPTVAIEAQASGVPCVLADTITEETDLNLGMVSRLSLEESLDKWCDEIIRSSRIDVMKDSERQRIIENKGFTRKMAAKLYTDYLYGKIHFYNL